MPYVRQMNMPRSYRACCGQKVLLMVTSRKRSSTGRQKTQKLTETVRSGSSPAHPPTLLSATGGEIAPNHTPMVSCHQSACRDKEGERSTSCFTQGAAGSKASCTAAMPPGLADERTLTEHFQCLLSKSLFMSTSSYFSVQD